MRKLPIVLSTAALVIAVLGATPVGEAALNTVGRNSVGTIHLRNNAVTSVKVRNGSLLRADFRAGQIPAGPAGATGPAGPAGPAGPPGASGLQTVFTTSAIDSSSPKTLTATCPSGKVALGGGVAVAPSSVNEVGLTTSYLASSTTWTASAREFDATATNWGLNVVVICATVAP
jgi:hypothetical protein